MDRKFLVNEVGVGVKNSIAVSYGKGKEGGRKEWLTGVVGVELGKDRERGKGRVMNEANSIRQGFLVWVRGLKTKQIRKEATATPTATHLSTFHSALRVRFSHHSSRPRGLPYLSSTHFSTHFCLRLTSFTHHSTPHKTPTGYCKLRIRLSSEVGGGGQTRVCVCGSGCG